MSENKSVVRAWVSELAHVEQFILLNWHGSRMDHRMDHHLIQELVHGCVFQNEDFDATRPREVAGMARRYFVERVKDFINTNPRLGDAMVVIAQVQVIGYRHPEPGVQDAFRFAYSAAAKQLGFVPETLGEMEARLKKG